MYGPVTRKVCFSHLPPYSPPTYTVYLFSILLQLSPTHHLLVMRTNRAVRKQAMIMARNKEKAAKYKTGPSSEDVWKVRKEPLENAFTGVPVDIEAEKNDAVP